MALTSAQITELLKRRSGDPVLYLITIWHPEIDTIRLARNIKGRSITSRGTLFTASYVMARLAPDTEELPAMEITIPNVDREIGITLKAIKGDAPRCTLECCLASDPDVPFRRYAHFRMVNVKTDALAVTASLQQIPLENEPYPNRRVVPGYFYSIYRA